MAIVAMKHLRLLGMESEREALLKTMQDLECVEISHIDGSEEALKTGLAKPDDRALLNAQEESRAYRAALAALDRFAPEKKGMFRKRQGVSRASFFDEENERQARAAAEAINADMRRLGEIESERTKNEALRASLTPWLAVDAPLDSTDGVLSLLFGTVGATVTDDALRALSDSLSGLLTWQQASSDKTLRYLLIACHKSVKEQALSALRELGFSTVSFRGLCGTAEENDKKLEAAWSALAAIGKHFWKRVTARPSYCGARRRKADSSKQTRYSCSKAGCLPTAAQRLKKRLNRLPVRSKRASRRRTNTRRFPCSSETTS